MSIIYEERFAVHPQDFKSYDTDKIRENFLVENLFNEDQIKVVYSHYDRLIVGGMIPKNKELYLETIDPLKSSQFLDRREMGIVNIGGDAVVKTSDETYELGHKEALYLGKETKEVKFSSVNSAQPARLYFTSAPAHKKYPSKKVTLEDAEQVELGALESSNARKINKLIVHSVVQTCQLQMGMTELKAGSVWNTMPAHTHSRRMEAYLYFEVPGDQGICHFMGQPDQTRHIWMKNEQVVISPNWSIHSAAGTSNYIFVWGMAGENLDYGDMDKVGPTELK
jgi:4-deoxy-L-threo-5-hexosulose-uronate ketol-isomerase